MKKFLVAIAVLIISLTTAAQDTIVFTLDDCMRYAQANSYERKGMELNNRLLAESLRGAKLAYAPSISASIGENMTHRGSDENVSFSGNAQLGANITILNMGTIRNIEQQKIMTEMGLMNRDQFDQNLNINIIRTYVTIIGEMELIKYQEKIVATSEQQLAEGEKKYNVGSILESDYLLLEAQYQSNATNLLDSKNSLENSLLEMKILMSMDPTTPFSVTLPSDEAIEGLKSMPSREDAIQRALNNMPEMRLSQNTIDQARQSLKVAKSSYAPTIGASASIGIGHNNFENFGEQLKESFSQSVGISVSIPIYDRSQTQTQVRKAKISLEQAQYDQKQTELEIKNTIVQTYTNVQTSMSRYDATTKKYQAWQKTMDAYNTKYRLGAITTVDLLQQENNYISALNDYIQAKYNFMMQREILNIYMGL